MLFMQDLQTWFVAELVLYNIDTFTLKHSGHFVTLSHLLTSNQFPNVDI